ncbi:MAG: SMP-30/gluconolactonase/LRE family protein [Deltaproteobacteria bacterium]|nr:SMP-30/gluconolactonase/LRE family protein [Deltaproteobacteria bacterium]
MRKNQRWVGGLALLVGAALSGCGGGKTDVAEKQSVLARSLEAMGGAAAVAGLRSLRVAAGGEWFEPEQTYSPGMPPRRVSGFEYALTADLTSSRSRSEWTRAVDYPFAQSQRYTEVMSGGYGVVDGNDRPAAPATTAMPSVRIATTMAYWTLTTPVAVLKTAALTPAAVESRANEEFEGRTAYVLAVNGAGPTPVRLFIDSETYLPIKADMLQDDPYYGDTLTEAVFDDWRPAAGVMAPYKVGVRLVGLGRTITIATEERWDVTYDVPLTDDLFLIPEEMKVTPVATELARGAVTAQWHWRRQAIGLPGFTDQGQTITFEETAPGSGLYFAGGGTHNSLIVEMKDHLIALEPGLYESRSEAVIAAVRTVFPAKPIRYAVVSHFHIDHGGGVRSYAALGATIVVGEAARSHFEAILAAPHSLVPDRLEREPRPTAVLGVPSTNGMLFSDGARTVGVYPVEDQSHAAGYLMSWVSGEDVAFDSGDLYSPPATPIVVSAVPRPLRNVTEGFNLPLRVLAGGHGRYTTVSHDEMKLPRGFRPEGVTLSGGWLYIGSIPTGRIVRTNQATGATELVVGAKGPRSAIGLKVDDRGRIFVAGGQRGEAYVYDAESGAELATYTLATGNTFINDVTLTAEGAWFTDSRGAALYLVPVAQNGALAPPEGVVTLPLSGDFVATPGQTSANGIVATADGNTLIIGHSSAGKLYAVDRATGVSREILLGADSVPNADGIYLDGLTLYVVQNRLNQVAVVNLAPELASGTVVGRLTDPRLDVPSTLTATSEHLYLVNARFGVSEPDNADYLVVRLPKP